MSEVIVKFDPKEVTTKKSDKKKGAPSGNDILYALS